MSPRHRCALLAVALMAGCAVWRPLPGAGFAGGASERLDHARVVLRDGTDAELDDATISRDSIIGFRSESRTRFAAARSEVTGVEAWQPNAPKSFVAGVLIACSVLAAFIVTAIVLFSGEAT